MSNMTFMDDGGVVIKGSNYTTETNVEEYTSINTSSNLDYNMVFNDDSEFNTFIKYLFNIPTIEADTKKIRLDKNGNLTAKVIIDTNVNRVSITKKNEIKVKYLTQGGI